MFIVYGDKRTSIKVYGFLWKQNNKMATQTAKMEDLSDMDDYSLLDLLEQTQKSNETMSKEINMFEKFLKQLGDSKDVQSKAGIPTMPSSQVDMRAQRKKGKTNKGGGTSIDKTLKLTVEQKCDIATRELEELRDEQQRAKEDYERAWDNHKAIVDEAEIRTTEIKKSWYEFDRDIVKGALNQRTGKIKGEKVVKYFDERIKAKDALIEKLRLKNATLRVKKRKLGGHLKVKEEAGEVRSEVDFEQLKIENKQFSGKFDEKNEELLKLKLSAGNTLQILNSYKKKLHALSAECGQLDSEISQRTDLLQRVQTETTTVNNEKSTAEEVNAEARKKLEDFKVPDVMEYVQERSSLYELSKKVRAWERKVEIAEMALRSYKQTWARMSHQHTERLHQQRAPTHPPRLH
ncbi:coiled-coil domain-containing protein 113-like [Halichondria panicea]|uniref:coiled-coil domain-containing protein 113-like n=1 Tax=Halichondria panicea TaxID=6063 RepID=UPI00312B59D2